MNKVSDKQLLKGLMPKGMSRGTETVLRDNTIEIMVPLSENIRAILLDTYISWLEKLEGTVLFGAEAWTVVVPTADGFEKEALCRHKDFLTALWKAYKIWKKIEDNK